MAGHQGMVGSAIVRRLTLVMPNVQLILPNRGELDLVNQSQVKDFLRNESIDYIFIAAAKVGGIYANNKYRAQFIYENLMIEANLINGAYQAGIMNLMFMGSSCIYPRDCPQPIREEYLLTGPLEPTNEPYAISKIAGIKMCESYNRQYGTNYVCLMPTNLYGLGDNYELNNSHVIPALIRKVHEAKVRGEATVDVWGSGQPRREFLYVDDLAEACVHFMSVSLNNCLTFGKSDQEPLPALNVGTGQDMTIAELAYTIMATVGFNGALSFDKSKPDGTPQKLLDVSRANALGWRARTKLEDGIALAYEDFLLRGSLR